MKRLTFALAAALLAAGCAAPASTNGLALRHASGVASIAGAPTDKARLVVQAVPEPEAAARRLLDVAGLVYDGASLTLSNASLLTAPKTRDIAITGDHKAQIYAGLRPGAGYGLDVVLKNGATRVGTGRADLTLQAGTNTALVVIGRDGRLEVQTSVNGNAPGDANAWYIVKGDTVSLVTGFAATETGVAKMTVTLGSDLYTTEHVIATVTTTGGAGCGSFTWDTGTTTGSYDPSSLIGTATGTQDGHVTFTLYDAADAVVGKITLPHVNVIDPASIDLQLQ